MRRCFHIVLLLLLAVSCGPEKIPRDDMQLILRDMLIQDQQIKMNRDLRQQADTSLVYEGIFKAYGYDTDDFIYSLTYYLEDASRMERIMQLVAEELDKEAAVVQKEIHHQDWVKHLMGLYNMKPDTTRKPWPRMRAVDSLRVRFSGDSVWVYHPFDSLSLWPRDSLLFLRDTLEVRADSLSVPLDSLKK